MAKLKQKKNDRRIFLILTSNICVSNITSIVVIQNFKIRHLNQKPIFQNIYFTLFGLSLKQLNLTM